MRLGCAGGRESLSVSLQTGVSIILIETESLSAHFFSFTSIFRITKWLAIARVRDSIPIFAVSKPARLDHSGAQVGVCKSSNWLKKTGENCPVIRSVPRRLWIDRVSPVFSISSVSVVGCETIDVNRFDRDSAF